MEQKATAGPITVQVRNVGGISEQTVELFPGVNVLAGQNATNRTSFLKALATAQGSERVSLKGDQSEGAVSLSFDDTEYSRTIRRVGKELVFEGETPVDSENADAAELFAFLFERNQARDAIRQGGDLRSVVMEPVDTEEIQRQLDSLKTERSELETELEQLHSLEESVPALRERRSVLTEEITTLETEIESKQDEIASAKASVDDSKEKEQEIESKVQTIRSKQSELDRIESKIETTEQTITHLETNREEAKEELAELSTVEAETLSDIEASLSGLHDQVANKETMMSELQNIIQFNKDFIEAGTADTNPLQLRGSKKQLSESTLAAEKLSNGENEIVCWTCGTPTAESNIAEMVEQLQSIHEDLHGEREQLRKRIEQQQQRKDDLEAEQERREKLEESLTEIANQLAESRDLVADLRTQQDRLCEEIAETESDLAELRQGRDDGVLELHQDLNTLKIDLQELTEERASVINEIETIESEIATIDTLERDLENVEQQITALRERVDRIERDVVTNFNEHMDSVLEILSYENIARVWIERREVEARDDRRKIKQQQFELHVIREGEDGTAYEDTVAHLSESEREVTGLIFALAGYLVYEVHEYVPFMLLDSLEAIDSDRIVLLIEHIEEHAENVVIALLEEDAAALSEQYHRIEC